MAEGNDRDSLDEDLPADIKLWTKHHVRKWVLNLEGDEERVAEKLFEEDVDGSSLLLLNSQDFQSIGIKLGPAKRVIQAKEEWLKEPAKQSAAPCCPYPFDRNHDADRYTEHSVLLCMESGPSNLIEPCHEFKAFTKTTHETKMKKFTDETIRFAAACMNSRTNGTIHFGIGDTKQGFEHGQVLGVDVEGKEEYAIKLQQAIQAHFEHKNVKDAKKCIRHPRFVGVLSGNMTSTKCVIEVDIVPNYLICKENYYHTYSHDMSTKTAKKKVNESQDSQPSTQFFVREGGSTVDLLKQSPQDKKGKRYQSALDAIPEVSKLRKRAEEEHLRRVKSSNQGALLAGMVTGGSMSLDQSNLEHYVIVTNKSHPSQLESLAFLVDLNPIGVLDFDPESATSGLQNHLNQLFLVNVHFPEQYKITEKVEDMAKRLNLTRNTSWIFCNGDTEQKAPSEIDQWLMEKGASVRDVISFLCRPDVLPRKRFLVIFLLLSTVNDMMDPVVETFCTFSQELRSTQQILCISDNKSGFTSWKNLIEARSKMDISDRCIYELSFPEVNGTILNLWSEKQRSLRFLPCGGGSTVVLGKKEEQSMSTLEVLCTNECEGGNKDIIAQEEENFYRGGTVTWWNFYISEQPGSSQFIKRDMLDHILDNVVPGLRSLNKACVVLNLKHLPGCGGTTLAMHTLWSLKHQCRCAVLREDQADQSEIAKHVVKLLTHERNEGQPTVPVLLMIDGVEDEDKVSDLQELIETQCEERGIQSSSALVLLLNCRRSESSPSIQSSPDTVFIGDKLSPKEQKKFEAKLREIQKTYKNADTFYGFMIMKENFHPEYIQRVVRGTLKSFDRTQKAEQLFAVLVLLNVYGWNASLSVSQCEDFLDTQQKPCCGKNQIEDEFGRLSPLLRRRLVEGKVKFFALKLIHSKFAIKCLNELSSTHSLKRADIVDILLNTDAFYGCTQGRDHLLQELRYILVNRQKNKFSPFIEDVARETPGFEQSVLENASKRFEKDAVVCQLLARYNYLRKKDFREAKRWARKARALHKDNSYIADTSAQVIKHELKHTVGNLKEAPLVPEKLARCLKLAHEATEAFKETQSLAKKESVHRLKNKSNTFHNTSGCLGEIEVDVLVIEILENIPVFSADDVRHRIMSQVLAGQLELQRFQAMDPQKHRNKPFHDILKQYEEYLNRLKGRMRDNFDFLDKIHINLSTQFGLKAYYDQDLDKRLLNYFRQYTRTFCHTTTPEMKLVRLLKARQFLEMEKTDSYSGILKCLSEGTAGGKLEASAREYESLCKQNPTVKDCINSIYVRVVLSCTQRESEHIPPYQELVDRLQNVLRKPISVKDSSSTYFIAVVLLWPCHQHPTQCESLEKYISLLKSSYHEDMKQVYCGKWPVLHFFLGNRDGYDRLVHLRQIKACFEYEAEHFASMWRNGYIWKDEKVKELLLRVTGEIHGDVILADTGTLKLEVSPMSRSQISGYYQGSKISFFIGFTMKGPTALDIMPENQDRRRKDVFKVI